MIFSWFQKATLGTGLALNPSRRPRLPLNPFPALLAAQQHVLWPPAGRFPCDFLLVSENYVRHRAPLGHLPGAFLVIFSWFQKATLGTGLALNPSRRPRLPLNPCPALLAAQQHVLWPPAGRFPCDFLLVSESDVRHWAGLKPFQAP